MSLQNTHTSPFQQVDYATATAAACIEALKHDGAVIVKKVLPPDILDQIKQDVAPAFARDVPFAKSNVFPKETRRANGLIGKSPAFTNQIIGNHLYQSVCDALLTKSHEMVWGAERQTKTLRPILDATTCFSVGPGAGDQPLHRDDSLHHNILSEIASAEAYNVGRDDIVAMFIAGTDTTEANGATRLIPKSHLWGMDAMPQEKDAFHVELHAGDGLIMLGSCFHGGSANTTADEYRLVFAAFMTKGINRTEENHFLANSLDDFKKYSREIQNIAGFRMGPLGWVDFRDPKHLLADDPALCPPGYNEDI
ncbi:phytanoyl-CoA dioxygenase family protein [Cordyceps fumosorosea ARSEF 2679]|uniref:Phytanoyl-CoA dioxygenase family protein n=1 Tax=Cordyceps fumosorosea (strain ARSEF 2679) TaxID=1081104 RepID=A0A167DLG0_CORFA|nr:phytanoyl-CoA dioxygenase family protein [Cordyceps fumosorosea ARSEF 2679]OAA42552.1 phytanoyl-CoA dioxygenase family protein [Cordyceps fumosorosea ARSEF 2679]